MKVFDIQAWITPQNKNTLCLVRFIRTKVTAKPRVLGCQRSTTRGSITRHLCHSLVRVPPRAAVAVAEFAIAIASTSQLRPWLASDRFYYHQVPAFSLFPCDFLSFQLVLCRMSWSSMNMRMWHYNPQRQYILCSARLYCNFVIENLAIEFLPSAVKFAVRAIETCEGRVFEHW